MLLDELTEQEANKVYEQTEEWSDKYALGIAKADFEQAEIYRTNNHDHRWVKADELYVGYERQRYWEGSKVPRSSVGMFVVLSQIESLLPKILSTIFSDNPWFEVGPQPGTTLIQANQVRDLTLYQLEQSRKLRNESIREVFRRAIKSGLKYGAGIVEIGWLDILQKIKKLVREMQPVTQTINDPKYGKVEFPTGKMELKLAEHIVEMRKQMPFVRHVSTKDFYIDPNCQSPQVQAARFACTRAMFTVDEILALKETDGFRIPPKAELLILAMNKPTAQGDQTKAGIEIARQNSWNPANDTTADAGGKRLEVITYWTAQRCVWLLNREHVLYNDHNYYGFIPLFNAFYTDVTDRFYGLAVTDIVEGEHRVQGGIINARMDELSLKLHGGVVKRRGTSLSANKLSRKPGRVIEADTPKEDVVFEQMQEITPQSFLEINASENRVQKSTGITDLAMQGTPSAGGNSANRTATGVGAQVSAAFSRLTYLVENIEDTFVEPILSGWHTLNTLFLDPEKVIKLFQNDRPQQIDPLAILNADICFYMRASSKMQSRMALQQSFGMIAQTFLNPAYMELLHGIGMTVDTDEISQMIVDMTGYKMRGRFLRPLTKEEQQRIAQAKPEENVKLQMQRERMKDLQTLQDSQNQADLQMTVVEKGLDAALEPEEEGNDA